MNGWSKKCKQKRRCFMPRQCENKAQGLGERRTFVTWRARDKVSHVRWQLQEHDGIKATCHAGTARQFLTQPPSCIRRVASAFITSATFPPCCHMFPPSSVADLVSSMFDWTCESACARGLANGRRWYESGERGICNARSRARTAMRQTDYCQAAGRTGVGAGSAIDVHPTSRVLYRSI